MKSVKIISSKKLSILVPYREALSSVFITFPVVVALYFHLFNCGPIQTSLSISSPENSKSWRYLSGRTQALSEICQVQLGCFTGFQNKIAEVLCIFSPSTTEFRFLKLQPNPARPLSNAYRQFKENSSPFLENSLHLMNYGQKINNSLYA